MNKNLKLNNKDARVFINSDLQLEDYSDLRLEGYLEKVTDIAIVAHQDDLEIMAGSAIIECFYNPNRYFLGIVLSNSVGPAKEGPYQGFSNQELAKIRANEQEKAATIGDFSCIQLAYTSKQIKEVLNSQQKNKELPNKELQADLLQILNLTNAVNFYTHNPFDKHPTHIGVFKNSLLALRATVQSEKVNEFLGGECWRGLDWLPDHLKVLKDISQNENLYNSLVSVYDSQISGGKRYDLASLGRLKANATFINSHQTDDLSLASYYINLKPLLDDSTKDPKEFAEEIINEFKDQVISNL